MKRIILLFLLIVNTAINAQSNYKELPGRWRLGFNMGGIWESSDVKPSPGLGGGFTIEKILNKRSNALLGFSLGVRYLGGRTYGLAGTPTYDISKNQALNGTYNPVIRYDTMPGYFFANHKTFIQEGSLELKMNFPRLEKNTGIIFHLWGGLGIGKYKTWIDALDKDGNMYDFSRLQGQHVSQSDLTRIYDGKYETLAMGSGTRGTFCLLPSIGAGLGYRLSKHVSLVLEHKISFPGTNLLDGIEYPKNCPVTGSKDFYNYTSVGLVFTFYGQHHSHSSGSTSSNNGTPVSTPTVANNNPVYTAPAVPPPTVSISYPSNNFNSTSDYTSVNAVVHNVTSSQQINISQNGYAINHFSFNASNGSLHFQTFLAHGANNFVISATNSSGTASQGVTVNYSPVPTFTTNGLSTTVGSTVTTTNTVVTTNTVTTISSPTVSPVFTGTTAPTGTTVATATVGTSVHTNTTVPTTTVSTTHTVTPSFTTTPTSTVVTTSTVSPSVSVTPTFTTSPTGTVVTTGTVSPSVSVTPTFTTSGTATVTPNDGPFHGTATVTPLKPVVSFIDPNAFPAETSNATYNVIGSVINVTGASQILVSVNGNNVPNFVYNPVNKQVTFVAVLDLGNNTITIKGTNNNGSDSKSIVINRKQSGRPPKVHISSPSTSPFTSLQSNVVVSGYVYNVLATSDIHVTANNAPANFNYNNGTHEISIALNLATGNTVVNISATNQFGSDAGSITLLFPKVTAVGNTADSLGSVTSHTQIESAHTQTHTPGPTGPPGGPHNAPIITVLSPSSDPFNTSTGSISISSMIDYIVNAAQVTVNYNGVPLSVSFDLASKHLNFSSTLKPGQNTFVISASNNDGTVNRTINVNYTPAGGNTTPSNSANPGGNPTNGHGSLNTGGLLNNGGGGKTGTGNNPGTQPVKTNTTPGGTITPGKTNTTTTPTGTISPGKTNTTTTPGGTINPGKPIKTTTPGTDTPKPASESTDPPAQPVNDGGTQIKVRPR